MRNDNGLLIDEDGRPYGHIFTLNGNGFAPTGGVGPIDGDAIADHNRALDEALILGLDENCEIGQCGFFYWKPDEPCSFCRRGSVTTWTGVEVARGRVTGDKRRTVHFARNGKSFRGVLQRDADCFNFRRIG